MEGPRTMKLNPITAKTTITTNKQTIRITIESSLIEESPSNAYLKKDSETQSHKERV